MNGQDACIEPNIYTEKHNSKSLIKHMATRARLRANVEIFSLTKE